MEMPHRAEQPGQLVVALTGFKAEADAMMHDPQAVSGVLQEVKATAGQHPKLTEAIALLYHLVKAHVVLGVFDADEEDDVAWALAACLYVVSPWDLTPDYLPGGLYDDIRAAEWVREKIDETLLQFSDWEVVDRRMRTRAAHMAAREQPAAPPGDAPVA